MTCLALASPAVLSLFLAAQAPAPAQGPLGGELQVDGKYGFIVGPSGERGYYGKVLVIDGSWVKIEAYYLALTGKEDPPYEEKKQEVLWLNLAQVTAVVRRPPASLVPIDPAQGFGNPAPGGNRGFPGRGGPGGPGGRGDPTGPGGGRRGPGGGDPPP